MNSNKKYFIVLTFLSILIVIFMSITFYFMYLHFTENKPTKEVVAKVQENKQDNKSNQIELNKPFDIDGRYTITFEGVRTTSQRNELHDVKPLKVFYIDYSYNNTNTDDLFISEMNFKVMDDNGNVLSTYPVSETSKMPKSAPKGGKVKASVAYALTEESKNIKVIFYDNMFLSSNGEITIELK